MLELIFSNYLLWFNFAIPLGIGIYLIFTHSEYVLKEFAAQVALTFVILISFFSLGYYSSDVYASSYNNGYATGFVYEEEWTELVHYTEEVCTGTGDKRRCETVHKTREDYHPDYYYLTSTVGTISIGESQYRRAASKFGFRMTDSGHMGQISHGDGRTFEVTPKETIPVVVPYTSLNYIYASKNNIIKSSKIKDLEKRYKGELVPYPKLVESEFGNPTFNRIFNAHLSPFWKDMNEYLSKSASIYGAGKEINPIIYLTTAQDREFAYVVKGFYQDAHKNDAVLVVGVDQKGVVTWSAGLAITKSEDFIVDSQNFKGYNLRNKDEALKLVKDFESLYLKSYKREPMENYKYLISEIDLPVWYQLLIVIINAVGSFFLFRWFLVNRF